MEENGCVLYTETTALWCFRDAIMSRSDDRYFTWSRGDPVLIDKSAFSVL